MLEKLKKDTNYASDIIYKEIKINNRKIYIVYSEVLSSGDDISKVILKNISYIIEENLIQEEDLYYYLYIISVLFIFKSYMLIIYYSFTRLAFSFKISHKKIGAFAPILTL